MTTKKVLIIITGGTICMSVDATSNSLAPQKNVVVNELKEMILKRKGEVRKNDNKFKMVLFFIFFFLNYKVPSS